MTVKKKNLLIKIAIIIGVVAAIAIFFITRQEAANFSEKYEGVDLSYTDRGRSDTYAKYLKKYDNAAKPQLSSDIEIDILSYINSEGITNHIEYSGEKNVIESTDTSMVEYTVNIPESGFYNIAIRYMQLPGRGIDIERMIYINGEIPFLGADIISLSRIWSDTPGGIKQDNQGNDIRPTQIENPQWQTSYFMDSTGYEPDPYKFYFEKGKNTIAMVGTTEPMMIKALTIKSIKERPTYAEYEKQFDSAKYSYTSNVLPEPIQGESAQFRSSPSLYGTYDRSSGLTVPYSVMNTRLNMIGGQAWRVAGQWIEWTFTVPADGEYSVSLKARQNYSRGRVSNRSVYIDGEIPFEEVAVIPFKYSNNWQMVTFEDANGDPVYFRLTEGEHTIKLMVTLGELSDILTELEESVFRLNEIYMQILVLTGAEPDIYRDYRISETYPELMKDMDFESRVLFKLFDELVEYSGETSAEAAALQTIAKQLEKFVNKPQDITKALKNFKENISSIGNSLVNLATAQLDIDLLYILPKGVETPKINEGFFTRAKHEINSFVASFIVDYDTLGDVHANKEAIDVWMMSGRDQSTILKTMIDDTYTPETRNLVNVRLVALDTLMPAVVAGTGPDVALTIGNADPVNYAFRKAAIDLTQFDDFEEVASEFAPSTLVPYKYEGGIYGLPETLNFNVMFYRKDIFEDLGIEIPNTWDDLIKIIPIIQKNNMNVGIPSVERKISEIVNPDLSNFFCQLYQNGGALYNEQGSRTLLDSEVAVEAFENYTKLFTHYKAPMVYDFVNRFRTGEMPLGFVDYNTFNTLAVSAPEIRGLWDFAVLPGTVMSDGTINRSVSCWGQASMLLANSDNPYDAWQFLRWWVNADTQVRFGRELESLMGASARYATANQVAFEQLAWSAKNSATLKEQWEWAIGTPEVPGGYYSGRHIVNAVRRVINNKEDTRETLLDYTRTINDELKSKREEFGLDVKD